MRARLPLSSLALLLCLALIGAGYLAWSWSPELAGFGGDNAAYLLAARHLSPYAAPSEVADYFAQRSIYPPLFPLLLAVSGGGDSLTVAHLVAAGLMLGAFLLFYVWLRQSAVSSPVAICAMMVLALLPGCYFQALNVHSEGLYLVFSLGALWLAAAAQTKDGIAHLWGAAFLVAAASLTRTAGIALVIAFAVQAMVRSPRRSWGPALLAVAPAPLWELAFKPGGASYVGNLHGLFGSHVVEGLLGSLPDQVLALWGGWAANLLTSRSGIWAASVLGVLGMVAALLRLIRWQLDGLYVAAYLALLLIWPYPAEATRLVLVILPVLLGQMLLLAGASGSASTTGLRRAFPWLPLAILAIYAVPGALLTVQRFTTPVPAELRASRHSQGWFVADFRQAQENLLFHHVFVVSARDLARRVPAGECIYSIKPTVTAYYSGRISIGPPRGRASPRDLLSAVRRGGCNYIFGVGFSSPTFPEMLYPLSQLHEGVRMIRVYRSGSGKDAPLAGALARLAPDGGKEAQPVSAVQEPPRTAPGIPPPSLSR